MSDSDYNVIHNPNGWRTTTITCSFNADQVETVKHLHSHSFKRKNIYQNDLIAPKLALE